jgi:hypothetical protein
MTMGSLRSGMVFSVAVAKLTRLMTTAIYIQNDGQPPTCQACPAGPAFISW